jgi:hypothetical protein
MQFVRSVEGRRREAFVAVGSDAAPAASSRKRRLGRAWEPSGRHYDRPAGSRLDWDWREAANSRRSLVPGSAGLGTCRGSRDRRKNAADGAPVGASLFARDSRAARRGMKTLRRPALRPLRPCRRAERRDGSPRATKNRGVLARPRIWHDLRAGAANWHKPPP